ncbi:LysR substrate-binding domain-containing protein [Thalassotalea euphylliae]|uniref:LysR family transcriptional regulator n=1 Tax=Thalassotalea euphylliae TaxID=1655234 RepID=A0A3E0UAQ4_9GAMM|nr:LysR substrate-binding domain-containing protein [Thalassotalea euphylliae]REL34078.1 LysR family transcriptional regulator [Thalassotalea euphylliae]
MLELKHLRTIRAIDQQGSLTKAAEQLATSQSALSHQLKELEYKLATKLVTRDKRKLDLTTQGKSIKSLADEVLPKIDALVATLTERPQAQSLSLGFACHACFQWLMPICRNLQQDYPSLSWDIRDDVFEQECDLDILFTDEASTDVQVIEIKLGQFEQVAVVSELNPLSSKDQLVAEDFVNQVLLTYPVEINRLDIFNQVLTPANVVPAKTRKVANSHSILQMIHGNIGVAVLPDWLVNAYQYQTGIRTIPLAPAITKSLYIRLKQDIAELSSVKQLVIASRDKFATLMQPFQ